MGNVKREEPEAFWKGFQKHMGYTDKEMERFRKNPKKAKAAPLLASPKMRDSTMVFEVVEARNCSQGMKPGDKLYFNGCANLNPKRSSPWCAYALSYANVFAVLCHNMVLQGLDPNLMFGDHFSCFDCGSEKGWGQVIMKAYVIDEAKK